MRSSPRGPSDLSVASAGPLESLANDSNSSTVVTSSSRLLCVETPVQVERQLPSLGLATVLALTAQAEYACERHRVNVHRPEDYYSEDELQTLGFEQLAKLDQLCQLVDQVVLEEAEEFRLPGLLPGTLYWYHFKNLLNSAAVHAFILKRITERERPGLILYGATPDEPLSLTLEYRNESAWSRAIECVANSHGILNNGFANGTLPSVTPKRGSQVTKRLAVARRLLFSTRYMFDKTIADLDDRLGGHRGSVQPTIVTLSSTYGLRHLIRAAAKSSIRVFYFEPQHPWRLARLSGGSWIARRYASAGPHSHLDANLDRAWNRFRSSPQLESLLSVEGTCYFLMVERRLRHFFRSVAPDMLQTYLKTRAMVEAVRPAAILGANMPYWQKTVFEATRAAEIPTIVYSHGSSGGYVRMETDGAVVQQRNDFRHADYVFTNGFGDVQFFMKHSRERAKPIAVGSAVLDELRHRRRTAAQRSAALSDLALEPSLPTVFYVPTSLDDYVRPIPGRNRAPSTTFHIERSIADIFAQFPNVQCVFKLHAATALSPIVQYVKDRGYANCRVITEDFKKLVHLADAFVLDYPSTTLLEALTTNRPILFCGHALPMRFNREKWHPSILPMWKERVLYAEHLDEFLEMLRDFLRKGDFSPVKSSDEMLRLFGTHLNDGRSAERAVAELKKIIQTHAQSQRNDVRGVKDAIAVSRSSKS